MEVWVSATQSKLSLRPLMMAWKDEKRRCASMPL